MLVNIGRRTLIADIFRQDAFFRRARCGALSIIQLVNADLSGRAIGPADARRGDWRRRLALYRLNSLSRSMPARRHVFDTVDVRVFARSLARTHSYRAVTLNG